jgi:hypothetical protein
METEQRRRVSVALISWATLITSTLITMALLAIVFGVGFIGSFIHRQGHACSRNYSANTVIADRPSSLSYNQIAYLTITIDSLDVLSGDAAGTVQLSIPHAAANALAKTINMPLASNPFTLTVNETASRELTLTKPSFHDPGGFDAILPFTALVSVDRTYYPFEQYEHSLIIVLSTSRGPINLAIGDSNYQANPTAIGTLPVITYYECSESLQHFGMGASYTFNLAKGLEQLLPGFPKGAVSIDAGKASVDITYWRDGYSILFIMLIGVIPFLVPLLLIILPMRPDADVVPIAAVAAAMILVPTVRLACVPDGFTPPTQIDLLLVASVLATIAVYMWRHIASGYTKQPAKGKSNEDKDTVIKKAVICDDISDTHNTGSARISVLSTDGRGPRYGTIQGYKVGIAPPFLVKWDDGRETMSAPQPGTWRFEREAPSSST